MDIDALEEAQEMQDASNVENLIRPTVALNPKTHQPNVACVVGPTRRITPNAKRTQLCENLSRPLQRTAGTMLLLFPELKKISHCNRQSLTIKHLTYSSKLSNLKKIASQSQ
ncbi:uncharacterized protein LOC129976395 isoform X2 [Argiope bruennichi]|uniref:uncharacterized protein LOC129976395 isoform X2 n=1 Tax=Argiope bruennichi TaxID=94029 RepID=UPI0024956463|nr:uncharacterized protein LOC129976395 isoform X2 [Argiope bruennichi]